MILVLAEYAPAARVSRFSRHPANNAVDLKTWVLEGPIGMVSRFIVPTPGQALRLIPRGLKLMRRLLAVIVVGAVVSHGAREARAQAVMGGPYSGSYRVSDYFAAPGLYGTSYGFASYGVPRTFTTFSAYPGPSYGSNVPGYGFLPGRYGVGLWRPGFTAPGYVYGAPTSGNSYRTFPVVYGTSLTVDQIAPPPSIGVYAPALGPSIGLYGR